jgi:FAD/FMN-containing dehydrogenase
MDQDKISQLKQNFTGQIILPGDPDYDLASTTMVVKGSPAIVLRPRTPADVAAAIMYARENSLIISIKSGGHSVNAYGTNNGGLVIDMALMNDLEVIDKSRNLIRIGSGNTWGEVAEFLKPHGLAISSGDTKSVGVGGLTLGGGIGWMVRQVGLAIDSLKGAEIVTADGQTLQLSETENSDLFWAIRGGGGNFGVITSFEFEAHKLGKVFGGPIIYAFENLEGVIKGWRDCMRQAPEELSTMLLAMMGFNGGPPTLLALCCYANDDEIAFKKAIDPLLNIGKVVQNGITLKDYADVLEEAHPPQGIKVVVNNALVENFSDEIITAIASLFNDKSGPVLQIRSLGGAMNRIGSEATAFAHRNSEALILCPTFVAPNATESEIKQALKPWETIAAFSKGSYVNFVSEETAKHLSENYPAATLSRLMEIKKNYDPENVFSRNYNIKPKN